MSCPDSSNSKCTSLYTQGMYGAGCYQEPPQVRVLLSQGTKIYSINRAKKVVPMTWKKDGLAGDAGPSFCPYGLASTCIVDKREFARIHVDQEYYYKITRPADRFEKFVRRREHESEKDL